MTLDRDRPEILRPPEHPQACCTQQTITVPPGVLAKTAQKHDYPSAAWRRSYARRTGAERGFATAKDPATNDITRGWCRLMGLAPLMLFTTMLLVVRNQRILAAWNARQEDNQRRAAAGLPPRTRQTAPQDPRHARRRAAIASGIRNDARREHAAGPGPAPAQRERQHARNHPSHTESHQADTENARHGNRHTEASLHAGMSDQNVKIGLTET